MSFFTTYVPFLFPSLPSLSNHFYRPRIKAVQDTPAIKSTYSAKVTSVLPILMSALRVSPPLSEKIEIDGKTERVYEYDQPIAIPSYLIAVAGGEVVFAVSLARSLE